jgi:hypothetical protein
MMPAKLAIFIVSLETANYQRVTGSSDCQGNFDDGYTSDDGHGTIFFSRMDDVTYNWTIFSTNGSGVETRINIAPGVSNGTEVGPVFSGGYLYALSNSVSGPMVDDIWRVNPSTGFSEKLDLGGSSFGYLTVNPTGTLIAASKRYHDNVTGKLDSYHVTIIDMAKDLNSGRITQINPTRKGGFEHSISFSQDGKSLMFKVNDKFFIHIIETGKTIEITGLIGFRVSF